jgi:general secretion pathway protein G
MVVRKTRRHVRGGFTLMEMLVVVAIIVMLAGVGTYSYMRYLEGARESTAKLQIAHLTEAVEAYKTDFGSFPDSLATLTQPSDGKPAYIEPKDMNDPWGKPYTYEPGNVNAMGRPRLSTVAPSGTPIANW